MNPGELNKKIQIIRLKAQGTNENGFPLPEKEEIIRNCRAKVSNTSGSEILKANSEFSNAKKRFLVRYAKRTLNTDMIIRYNGKDYDIEHINSYADGREYIEIWTSLSERV